MHLSIQKYFAGRKLVFATMHGKENVLRNLFEEKLGVNLIVPAGFNTDDFGTFSGEVERKHGPVETAVKKCDAAAELTGESLVLASEGSFGGHPSMGFVPADEEWLVLKDYRNHWEIRTRVLSTSTNFSGNQYYDAEDAMYFAAVAGFPNHALIVRKDKDDLTEVHKGINTPQKLKESLNYFQKRFGKMYIETDMRAHFNPTRQKVIKEAGEKMIKTIYNFCPVCEAPGFQVKKVLQSLPFEKDKTPANASKISVLFCEHCGHSERQPLQDNKPTEDTLFFNQCNP